MNQNSKNISEQIEQVKIDLLSLVSHELRTPLTSVLNGLKMLQDGDLSKLEQEMFLDLALRNAESLNNRLNQILDLANLVSGRLLCRFHEVSIKNILQNEIDRFLNKAEALNHKVVLKNYYKELEKLPIVLADAPRLEQVFQAVLDNALKFSPPKSTITVELKSRVSLDRNSVKLQGTQSEQAEPINEAILLQVTNAVKSSHKEQQADFLFKIFSQQEKILNREHEGLGGSLAIASEVMQQHRGALKAEIASDGAFAATLLLPVLQGKEALEKVLESRLYALRSRPGALTLVLLETGTQKPEPLHTLTATLKAALFRASDSLYSLSDQQEIAIVMDDCSKKDSKKVLNRLMESLNTEEQKLWKTTALKVGIATSPDDAVDPKLLIECATQNKEAFNGK